MISDYKEYTLSQEFLVNQYKPAFVDGLNTSLKQAIQEGSASKILDMCVPLGIMYGVFMPEEIGGNPFFNTREGAEFLRIFKEQIDYEEAKMDAVKGEYLFYHYAAGVYRPLAQAYLAEYVPRQKDTEWELWEKMIHTPVWYLECPVRRFFPSYSWSAYLKDEMIKNDGSFYRMLEVLIRNCKDIRLDHIMRMNQWVHLENLRHSVQGTLVKGLIEAMETATHRKLEILAGMYSHVKTMEDYKQAVEGSCDSEYCRVLLVNALKNPEFFQVRKEKEFTDFLLKILYDNENLRVLWYIFYERYYFIPEPTEQERRVLAFLSRYVGLVELYWNYIKQQYSDVD